MRLKAAKYTLPQAPLQPPQSDRQEVAANAKIPSPKPLIDSNNSSSQSIASGHQAVHLPTNRVNENKPLNWEPQWYFAGSKGLKGCLEDGIESSFGQESAAAVAAMRAKMAELAIIELVKLSSMAAEEGNRTLALVKAQKALESFNLLKAKLTKERRKQQESSNPKVRVPMTTGVGLYELGLMVDSNLAHQLKNNGQRREAIEIYTQLCRMASSSISLTSSTSASQQQESQALLYRFGLNIGNIYQELGDHQRALKYYRLTLDRMSSFGRPSLRIKLMNNISLTLIAMQQISDATASLNLLLEDNLKTRPTPASLGPQVNNSNHHKFGLNLIVCHHQRGDLGAMLVLFKSLVGVDICHHYQRVTHFDNKQIVQVPGEGGQVEAAQQQATTENNGRMLQQVVTGSSRDDHIIRRQVGSANLSTAQNQTEPDAAPTTRAAENEWVPATERINLFADDQLKTNELSLSDSDRQQTNNDRLEMLIGKKQNQITRSLIMSCNLIFNLDSRNPASNKQQIKTNETSVLDSCMKVLQASETYRGLVYDLKANIVGALLEKRYKLDDAIGVLSRIELEQQVEVGVNSMAGDNIMIVKSLTGKNHLQPPTGAASKSVYSNLNYNKSRQWSPMVATNACLLNLLQGNTVRAIEFGLKALQMNNSNVKTLVNLANCYVQLDNLAQAESLCRRALKLKPTCWETNHNLALLARRMGRHHDQLDLATKQSLAKDWECSSSLFRRNMILSATQLALIQRQSDNTQHFSAIISTMMNSSKQGPEVHLLAGEIMMDDNNPSAKSSAINALQQANKEFPHHLPLAERLIALHIQNFNYDAANKLIAACIKNRPDQVKWYQMLAECYRRATNYNKSISIYKNAIESFPQDTTCLKSLIKLFDELGMIDESKFYVSKLNRALKT